MNQHTNDYLVSIEQDSQDKNIENQKNVTDSSLATTGKPTAVWESLEFEEFDLCMEVTAYVHSWD